MALPPFLQNTKPMGQGQLPMGQPRPMGSPGQGMGQAPMGIGMGKPPGPPGQARPQGGAPQGLMGQAPAGGGPLNGKNKSSLEAVLGIIRALVNSGQLR